MVSKNEHTGAKMKTGVNSDEYRDNFSGIFGLSPLDKRIWREYFEKNYSKGVDLPMDNPEVEELYTIWLREKLQERLESPKVEIPAWVKNEDDFYRWVREVDIGDKNL